MRGRIVLSVLIASIALVGCGPDVLEARPGQLLYVSTFDAFNEDWQLYAGELAAQIVDTGIDPALQIVVDAPQQGAFTLLDQVFGDFDVIVETTQVGGPDDNGFGVVFRHQDNNNYYAFLISGDGYYQVIRRLNGFDVELSDWAPAPAIMQGQATNTIRIIGQGDAFTFLINDVAVPLCLTIWNPAVPGECQTQQGQWSTEAVVWTLVDASFAYGRIGFAARSFDQQGVRVNFDNIIVCGPQAAPAIPYRCEEDFTGV